MYQPSHQTIYFLHDIINIIIIMKVNCLKQTEFFRDTFMNYLYECLFDPLTLALSILILFVKKKLAR